MNITGFIWLDDILEKLEQKHGVYQEEVREVFGSAPRFRLIEKGHRRGENVYAASGQTDGGRYIIVFFVHKKDQRALILSSRDMTPSERRSHEQK